MTLKDLYLIDNLDVKEDNNYVYLTPKNDAVFKVDDIMDFSQIFTSETTVTMLKQDDYSNVIQINKEINSSVL